MRSGLTALAVLLGFSLQAMTYSGRVVNRAGEPLPYATVYPMDDPVKGTATNNDGYFTFEADLASGSEVVISYIGYEKASVPSDSLTAQRSYSDSGLDSLQFHGEYCKRYFAPALRRLADSIYTTDILEQMGSKTRKAASAIDSGVVVHKGLFAAGNAKAEFGEYMDDVRHWSVNKENDDVTVLTYSIKKSFMLIFRVQYTVHFIVDSRTLRLVRSAEQMKMKIKIPFGVKLDAGQLAMLNMLNLSEQQINKFRLRQATADIHFNTLYQQKGEHIYILEKNLHTDATIIGAKKQAIPLEVNATQRITQITPNAIPLTRDQLTRRLQREIVEIY